MDIAVYLFMVPDEALELLAFLRGEGHGIFYMARWQEWARVHPSEALPNKLGTVLRGPSNSGMHFTYVVAGDRDPDETNPNKLIPYAISAQFGALADDILYKTSVTARSGDAPTLAAMKSAKKWLMDVSKPGALEFGLPKGRPSPVKALRYTEGAQRAFEAGTVLRQPGVAHVGFAIPPRKG